jgi:transposase-like protein
MQTQKRKTPEEKERILKEIEKLGVVEGCRTFKISANTYYNWKNKYISRGLKGLKKVKTNEQNEVIKELEERTKLLEQLIIEKDLTIKMQQDMIKKNLPLWKKEKRL